MSKLLLSLFLFICFQNNLIACNITKSANTNICIGTSTTLSVSGATTYTWQPGNTNGSNYTVQPTVTTIYTVYATGAGACLDTAFITITVDSLPLIITASAQTNIVCQGISPVLSATGGATYSWQPSGSNANPYNALPNATTIYTVTGATAQGCTKTATKLITVTPAPKPILLDSFAVATFAAPFNNCNNLSGSPIYTVTVSVPTNATITSYSLNWGNGSATVTGLTYASFPLHYTYANFGVYNLVLTANYANGCSRDTIISVVNQTNPAIGISNASGNTSGCGPVGYWFKMSNYQANATGTSYIWNFGDGSPTITWNTVVTDSIYHLFTLSSCGFLNNEFTVSITAINSCSFTKATVSSIKVFKKPDAAFTIGVINGCVGDAILFNNTSVPSQNAPNCNTNSSWVWNFGDGSPTVSSQNASHVYNAVGNYTVTLIGAGGCGADTVKAPICIEDNIVSFASSIPATCNPSICTFTNTSAIVNNCIVSPYTWSVFKLSSICTVDSTSDYVFVNSTNTTSIIPQIRFNNQGTYRIRLSHTNSCGLIFKDTFITIKRKPVAIVTAPLQICVGATLLPTVNVTNCGNNAIAYLWTCSTGTPTSSTNVTPSFVLPTGTHTYAVACTNECGTTVVNKTITVNAQPIIAISAVPNDTICVGINTILTASGANTYSWSGGSIGGSGTNKSFNASTTNIYTITGTSSAGCTATITQLIVVNALPIISASNTIPTCLPGNDASLTITASGGLPAYNYFYNATLPSVNNVFPNLGAGTYTCNVIDANGCTASIIKNIVTPNSPSINSFTKTNVTCNGNNNGSVAINIVGGTGAITYNLMPTNTNNTNGLFTNLAPNTYTIKAVDANGCSTNTVCIVTQPTILSWANFTTNNVLCNGQATGSITAIASGGNSGNTYNLMPGNSNNTNGIFTNKLAGIYTVTVTDSKGCSTNSTLTITQANAISWVSVSGMNITCNGIATGSITASATGGSTVFTYKIIPTNITNSTGIFNNLSANNYNVSATDGNGCTINSAINITQPTGINISNVVANNPSCTPGNDGNISYNANGGSGVLNYFINSSVQQLVASFNSLASGTYTINAIDANACIASSIVNITTPNAPIINSSSKINNACFGQNIGSISINATATNGAIQYTLNPGNITNTTGNFTALLANSYTVLVADNQGCNVQTSISITQPNILAFASASAVPASCFGSLDGSITVAAIGGTINYLYNLLPGNINNATGIFTNKPAGNYTVSITDSKGCGTNTTITITQAPTLNWNNVISTNVSCFDGTNATITATTIGGNGTINYTTLPITQNVTTGVFTGISANNYTLTATDGNGCTKSSIVIITQPNALVINSVAKTVPSCVPGNDGAISIVASGGVMPYNYVLNTTSQTNGSFTSLPSGSYTLSVIDANNCNVASTTNNVTPNAPQIDSLQIQNILCNNQTNGIIKFYASAGNGALQYKLLPTNISNASGIFNNLSTNNYTISATDILGCKVQTILAITNPLPILFQSFTTTPITCNGLSNASIVAIGNGGTGQYTFSILPTAAPANNTGAFANLYAANYTVHLQDANGCAVDSIYNVVQAPPVSGSYIIQQQVNCFGGSNGALIALANSGTAPFQYLLLGSTQVNTTGSFSNLAVGSYTVKIVDANLCIATIAPIVITQPLPLAVNPFNAVQINCYGGTTNALAIGATGGTALYTYAISPLGPQSNNTGSFSGLLAGTYTINIVDANGCTKTVVTNITQSSPILFSTVNLQQPKCKGEKNGSIQFTMIGGVSPLSYQLNNSGYVSNANFTNLGAGTYTIFIKDANACVRDSIFILIEKDQVKIDELVTSDVICENAKDGTIYIQTNGSNNFYGLLPDSISNASGVFNNLAAGTYTVFVKNNSGCTAEATVTISPAFNPIQLSISHQDLDCIGNGQDGWAQANPIGGAQPYTYQWATNPVQVSQMATNLTYGYYVVNVSDAKNCKISDTVYIKPGDCCASIYFPNAFTPNGDGKNDGFIPLSNAGRDLIVFGIYNRYGQEVWHANTIFDAWQGQELNGVNVESGSYYYIYTYTCLYDKKKYTYKGDVMLFR